jgi:hypothetical protein
VYTYGKSPLQNNKKSKNYLYNYIGKSINLLIATNQIALCFTYLFSSYFRKWSKVWSSDFYHRDTIWSRRSTRLGRRGSDDHLGRHSLPLSSNRVTSLQKKKVQNT